MALVKATIKGGIKAAFTAVMDPIRKSFTEWSGRNAVRTG